MSVSFANLQAVGDKVDPLKYNQLLQSLKDEFNKLYERIVLIEEDLKILKEQ